MFVAATGVGQLSIVVVLTALYPNITITLARIFLGERWNRAGGWPGGGCSRRDADYAGLRRMIDRRRRAL